jgi:hypothetical protein
MRAIEVLREQKAQGLGITYAELSSAKDSISHVSGSIRDQLLDRQSHRPDLCLA